ncbi:unnamed protein product [Calypogeia fissa]
MYRAIVQRGFDAADPESTLDLVTKPIPTAEPGHVVVHITLRPINPTDLVAVRTGGIARHYEYPVTVGSEGFGIVETIGEGVTLVKPGQRVVPLIWGQTRMGNGSWQEYASLKEDMVVPVPDSIPDEVAAQFVINPWTAIGMLEDLNVPKGEYFIQTAAGSVIGRQIIQLAKHLDIKSINIARRPEQKQELLALGADEVICSTTEDVVSRVKQITSKKLAYGALDAVGGELTQVITASVRRKGQVFIYGVLEANKASVGISDLMREVSVTGWILSNRWDNTKVREGLIQRALTYLEKKVIEPFVGEKYDLANFREAIKRSEDVGRGGKVLLTSAP